MKAGPLFVGALRLFTLPVAATLLLGACAGTTQPAPSVSKAPPEAVQPQVQKLVPTQPPAELGTIERFAWQQVVGLGAAFAAGDVEAFLAKVSLGFYRNYNTLGSSLKLLLENSRAHAAVVAVRLVTVEEGKVNVRAEWTRSVTLPDGRVDARHGETVFLFFQSDTSLRLFDYRGDAPFAIDGI